MDARRASAEKAESIYRLLLDALSADASVRVPAERHLADLENEQDFFASLASIASATDDLADPKCRWLAATCGKNAVKRSWRRYTGGSVTEEEREYVREVLLGMIGEKRREIREQVTEWIARVSRIDYPMYWPELLDRITSFLGTDTGVFVKHAVEICDAVIEQLASKRLKQDRLAFERATPGVMRPVLQLLDAHVSMLAQNLGQARRDDVEALSSKSLEISERCLKIARRLLIFGYGSEVDMGEVSFLFDKIISFPELFFAGSKPASYSLGDLSVIAAELLVRVFESHPLELSSFLPKFLPTFALQLEGFSYGRSSVATTAYAIRFIRDSLQRPEYKISRSTVAEFSEEVASSGPQAVVEQASASGSREKTARSIVLCYLADGRLSTILETILSQIMILSPQDLLIWETDPEEWLEQEEIGEAGDPSDWGTGTEGLRYEAQELINAFVALDKETVAQALFKMGGQLGDDPSSLLKRDALYRAIGTIIEDSPQLFDVDRLFTSTLDPMLATKVSHPAYQDVRFRVVMARAAWLVGRFGQNMDVSQRVLLYDALCPLLASPDIVVAFNAVRGIREMIEYMEAGSRQWGSCLRPCIVGVIDVARKTTSITRKRELLRFIDIAIDKAHADASIQCVDTIATYLAPLWANGLQHPGTSVEPGELSLLRISIVVLMTQVFKKLGLYAYRNDNFRSISLPIIRYGIDLKPNAGGLYMVEDACELWAAMLSSSDEYCEELDSLFPETQKILENDFDNLRVLSRIIRAYALLGDSDFMRKHGGLVTELLEMPIGHVRDRGIFAICDALDVCLQLFERDACTLFMKLLCIMLNRLMTDRESQVVAAAYVYLLLRASVYDWDVLERQLFARSEEAIVSFLVKAIEVVDIMYLPKRRNLAAFALCGIVTRNLDRPAVLEQIPSILNVTVQVLAERKTWSTARQRRGDFENYVSRYGEEGPMEDEERGMNGTASYGGIIIPELRRRQKLVKRDAPSIADIGQVTSAMMQSIKSKDESIFKAVIANTDNKILDQLGRFCAEGQGYGKQEN